MDWNNVKVLFDTYYPIVIAGVLSFGAMAGMAYMAYTKAKVVIQPIIDWLYKKDKEEEVKAVTSKVFEDIKTNTLKLDLQAKIDNPTISDNLRTQYQLQLDRLIAFEDKAN